MKSTRRIGAMIFKEFRQLLRDRITITMVVVIPMFQLILYGYAINTEVTNIPVGVVDHSQSAFGRQLVETVKATRIIHVKQIYATVKQAQEAIKEGRVQAVLVLPKDLMQRAAQGRVLGQWIVDGSDTIVSGAFKALQNMPLTDFDIPVRKAAPEKTFEIAIFYNPNQRSSVSIVPGLSGIILTMTMVMFTSSAIVREKERGNIELLITTPIQPLELMVAKIMPYIVVGLIQVTIILGAGHLLFGVPINGSILQILFVTLTFISASLSLGLLISTVAQTQMQASQMTIFILLPSILLSGFVFSYDAMPIVAQWVAEVLPATHFMRMIRGVVLRGADIVDMWPDTLWMLTFTAVGIFIAAKRFSKSLD
ncbi:ABC transporter permease [Shewanella sp. 202IG2-18]|uniref:ABC transporter permease n=1 Tax=Parashewanella hymeniacidonis TaxID=2807618 RepID=UPI00195F86BF|nr:ABC transporter permease [Parashewanella hymeniacidonis]MBM7071882.1 ABC transporter permease [Parashewanella hymeniacidonis]